VLRHAVRAEFSIETNTADAIIAHRHRISECSGARLYDELEKDLASGTLGKLVESMNSYGILPFLFGDTGVFLQKDPVAFKELKDLLDVMDKAILSGKVLAQEIILSVLFWPWMKSVLAGMDKGANKTEVLHARLCENNMTTTIPKHHKLNMVQVAVLLEKMLKSLKTSHMKWSLKKRARYLDASLMCDVIINKKVSGDDDPFRDIFMRTFPGKRSDV
jgi:tRNA nucleotidyltransferase/poly(A) polymerase